MKSIASILFWISFFAIMSCNKTAIEEVSKVESYAVSENTKWVRNLMADLTIEDKVGEMTQFSIDVLSAGKPYNLTEPHQLDERKMKKVLLELKAGSILNCGGHAYTREHWYHIMESIQEIATKQKASGIPVLYGIDAIHGTNYTIGATLFPQQLGQASTWNLELAEQCGEVTAYETRASAIPWDFAPVLDIGRDARWPRYWETYGEDVHLASQMGKAFVKGCQGDDVSDPYRIATTMKHFLGYSVTLRGKDRGQAWIPERQLLEYFVPTFQAAIDQGAKTIMINSGEMNGIPVHANKKILVDLLRDQMGFKGLAVTDWEDIGYLVDRHKIAKDFKEAIEISINAGIDMAMVPMDTLFPVLLKELVKEGKVPMSRINEAVERILLVKKELGLFENPIFPFENYDKFGGEEHRQMAYNAAAESIILLKNENNNLPFGESPGKILVTGPNADDLTALNGGWTGTWQGNNPEYSTKGKQTIVKAIEAEFGSENIIFSDGNDRDALINHANTVDRIVVCVGEKSYTEKPGDIDDLDIDPSQIALVKTLAEAGKPITLIITEGRPRIVRELVDHADGILLGFLPGDEGGLAIADIISGEVNPSGKLPVTYPKYANDLVTYDHKGTDLVHRDFSRNGFNPQWTFGHGLSYTTFDYKNLKINADSINMGQSMEISVELSNTGGLKGKEVVQLFVTDKVASITPSVKRLRGFKKIELDAGEAKTISFKLNTDDLSFVGIDNEWITEPGEFTVSIAGLKKDFILEN